MNKNTASSKSPKLPSSKVTSITDAKPKAAPTTEAAAPEAKKGNANKITGAKMKRVLGATSKRLSRLAAFFAPGSEIANFLTSAKGFAELATLEADKLPADWKPIRSQTARSFAALAQGGKCRIAKGLVEKYFVLLDDADGETDEEKTAALGELLIHKLGEKNSVVKTANGTRFAINTRHLRTL